MALKYRFNLKDIKLQDFKVYLVAMFKGILPKKKIKNIEDADEDSEPFKNGDYVTHGVYGDGEVLGTTKAGKHWSIEVNFDEGVLHFKIFTLLS